MPSFAINVVSRSAGVLAGEFGSRLAARSGPRGGDAPGTRSRGRLRYGCGVRRGESFCNLAQSISSSKA